MTKKISSLPWHLTLCLCGVATISCGSDTDDDSPDPAAGQILIEEVRFASDDRVELRNTTDETVDVSEYILCTIAAIYRPLNTLTVEQGSLDLEAGDSVVVSGFALGDAADVGLYTANTFADPDALLHYVKWDDGSIAPIGRESVAVQAGLWSAGDAVDVATLTTGSIEYDGSGSASEDWAIQTTPTLGN